MYMYDTVCLYILHLYMYVQDIQTCWYVNSLLNNASHRFVDIYVHVHVVHTVHAHI